MVLTEGGVLTARGSFAEVKSPSKNLANVQKNCPWLTAILKKLLVAHSFLGIVGNFREQLYLGRAIPQNGSSWAFFVCAMDHATF